MDNSYLKSPYQKKMYEDTNNTFLLNYDDHKIHKVAHMDYAVVTSKARGLGLQRRFFKEAEKQLEDTIYEYFLGTVHPDNIYSRTNFVKAGYREARQMSKYGGMQRIIMEKEK